MKKSIHLTTPLSAETVRKLKVNDIVTLTGTIYTARDMAHLKLKDLKGSGKPLPEGFEGSVIFHAGPVVKKIDPGFSLLTIGPTTSIREEPYEADIIRRFGLRAVMGKRGMGPKTGAALKEYGAVYLHAIGGAAQFYARCLPKVHSVYLLEELGVPEAMWVYEARNFPAIVTMDSHGNSLHAEVAATTGAELEKVGKR